MTLCDAQIKEILCSQGFHNIGEVQRQEHIVRDRSYLNKIVILDHNNYPVLYLIEKVMLASIQPFENRMYALFSESMSVKYIPRVFYNHFDETEQRGILLMEDLSPTYTNISDWNPPLTWNVIFSFLERKPRSA